MANSPEHHDRWRSDIEHNLTEPGRPSWWPDWSDTPIRPLSASNRALLREQGVHEPVASQEDWLRFRRTVRPYSVAYFIHVEDEEEGIADTVDMFGFSQTEGEHFPFDQIPGWKLDTALGNLAIKLVRFVELNPYTKGFSYAPAKIIAVNPATYGKTYSSLHEVAHVMLGHDPVQVTDRETLARRGMNEFQADCVAYLALNELGRVDEPTAAEHRYYIQGWLNRQTPADLAIRQVLGATDEILMAGREAPEESAE